MRRPAIIFFGLSLLISTSSFSQDDLITTYTSVIPPSPNAASLGVYGQVPVGMFTGTAQYSIPLYELKTRNLSIPIGLNYSSNGIKVDQIASWVGMGWSLSAGGVITRTVRDAVDETSTERFTFKEIMDMDPLVWDEILMDEFNEKVDTEPDLYAFNFPGYSGKFFFDIEDKVVLLPYQPLQVEVEEVSGRRIFTIYTPDGTQYVFGENDVYERISSQSSCADGYEGLTQINTSWYLTKIVHPAGDSVLFRYSSTWCQFRSGLYSTLAETNVIENNDCPECAQFAGGDMCATEQTLYIYQLDSIIATNTTIVFDKGSREDHCDKRLDAIIVRDSLMNTQGKRFEFNYVYSDNATSLNEWNSDKIEMQKRLFLESVAEVASDQRIREHAFTYYDMDGLPARLSTWQDHWGYYNAAVMNGTDKFLHVDDEYTDIWGPLYQADREPSATAAIKGLLKQITYPTGGTTKIEYEGHEYYDPWDQVNKQTGGMRVKRVISKESATATEQIVRYLYRKWTQDRSSADQPLQPVYYFSQYKEYYENGSPPEEFDCLVHTLSSNSNVPLYNSTGHHVAYSSVIKSFGDSFEQGGEHYTYRATNDLPGEIVFGNQKIPSSTLSNFGWNAGDLLSKVVYGRSETGDTILQHSESFVYNSDHDIEYKNAIAKRHYFPSGAWWNYPNAYLACDSTKSYETFTGYRCTMDHKHSLFMPTMKCTKGMLFELATGINVHEETYWRHPCYNKINDGIPDNDTVIYYNNIDDFSVIENTIISGWPYLKKKTVKQYDENGQNPLVAVSEYFYENPMHGQKTMERTINSNGDTVRTRIYYPFDYRDTTQYFMTLHDKSILAVPVDARVTVNSKLKSGRLIKYNEIGLPTAIMQAEDEVGTILGFDSLDAYSYGRHRLALHYDAGNQLEEVVQPDSFKISYIWAYNNTLPVIKADNIDRNTLQTAVSGAVAQVDQGYSSLEELMLELGDMRSIYQRNDWKSFNEALRSDPAMDNTLITTYTYAPLNGITSVTGPAGETTYYEYDNFGRLKNIEDKKERLVQNINYNYARSPELDASPGSLAFEEDTASSTIDIIANVDWTAADNRSWISIDQSSGTEDGSLKITVQANETTSARSGAVTISENSGYGLSDVTVTIDQDGITPYLWAMPNWLEFDLLFDSQNISVSSNTDWYVEVTYYDDNGWLNVLPTSGSGNGTISVSVNELPPYGQYWEADVEVCRSGPYCNAVLITVYNE